MPLLPYDYLHLVNCPEVVTISDILCNTNAQKKLFTVCAIGPIRLLALASYISLTNQILIFGILDLNFQSEFQKYEGSSFASSVLLCGNDGEMRTAMHYNY